MIYANMQIIFEEISCGLQNHRRQQQKNTLVMYGIGTVRQLIEHTCASTTRRMVSGPTHPIAVKLTCHQVKDIRMSFKFELLILWCIRNGEASLNAARRAFNSLQYCPNILNKNKNLNSKILFDLQFISKFIIILNILNYKNIILNKLDFSFIKCFISN